MQLLEFHTIQKLTLLNVLSETALKYSCKGLVWSCQHSSAIWQLSQTFSLTKTGAKTSFTSNQACVQAERPSGTLAFYFLVFLLYTDFLRTLPGSTSVVNAYLQIKLFKIVTQYAWALSDKTLDYHILYTQCASGVVIFMAIHYECLIQMVDYGNQLDSYGSSPCVNTDLLYHLHPEIIVAGHRNIHSQSSPELRNP